VIGISGPIATGKTTACDHIALKGFHYTRFSKVIEGILGERGIEVNRDNLQKVGYEIKEKGQRWLCKHLVEGLPEDGHVVIDGIRHPEDHAFLVETFGPSFTHVYIDTPVEKCEARYINNGLSKEDFIRAINHPVEENVKKLPNLAHMKVSNCGTLDSFIINIDRLANTITN
jgi:dephospho-CoA kinase